MIEKYGLQQNQFQIAKYFKAEEKIDEIVRQVVHL